MDQFRPILPSMPDRVGPATQVASQLRGKVKTLYALRQQGRITPRSFHELEGSMLALLESTKRLVDAHIAELRCCPPNA